MANYRPYTLPTETPYGVREYVTEIGVHVLDINYRADPAKRSDDWIRSAKQGKDKRTWQREFENDWSSVSGQPVFREYDPERHVATVPLLPDPHTLVVVGIDPGLSPAASFTQKNVFGQVQVFRTIQPTQSHVITFGALLLANLYTEEQLRFLFPQEFLSAWPVPMKFEELWTEKLLASVKPLCALAGCPGVNEMLPVKYVGDPAGMQKSAVAGGQSYFGLLKRLFRIVVHRSTNNWATRVSVLSSLLLEGANTQDGQPLFLLSGEKEDTEYLRDGFGGAYAYPETGDTDQPPKGAHSHPMDATEYAVMEHYPQGAKGVYSESQTQSFREILTGVAPPKPPNAEGADAPTPDSSGIAPTPKPLITMGQDGLPSFGDKPWNPFLDSLAQDYM